MKPLLCQLWPKVVCRVLRLVKLTESIEIMASNIGSTNSSGRLGMALRRSTSLIAPAIALASLAAPLASYAAADATTDVQAVVVTGSRIPQPNLTSISPLTTVGQAEIKAEGVQSVEGLLNNLPQVVAGQGLGQSINATGTATVDLRGIGPKRTLVLVDGRRLQPGDPTSPVADLNQIPAALVDRVDVVTGGASAVYGADAVAGVVNFIMKKNFQGVQFDAQVAGNQSSATNGVVDAALKAGNYNKPGGARFDGQTYSASVVIGASTPDAKGNITAYGTYFNAQPVTQSMRDYSACGLYAVSSRADSKYDGYICAGSSNGAYGKFKTVGGSIPGGGTFAVPALPTGYKNFSDNPDGTNTFVKNVPTMAYNFNTLSYLQRQDDRYNAGYLAHYELTPQMELYSDFMFAQDRTHAQYAPSGLFAGGGAVPGQSYMEINCNNPLASAQQLAALCGVQAGTAAHAFVLAGYRFAASPRSDSYEHTSYKIDLGVKGTVLDNWNYDVYGQYGTSSYLDVQGGYASLKKVQNALLVNPADPTKCLVDTSACVPLNLFLAKGAGISPAAYGYVLTPGIETGRTTEQIVSGSVSGDLGKYGLTSPWAKDGVGIALGAEYRRENLVLSVDNEEASGDLSGGSQKKSDAGTYEVKEVFGELRAPLIQDHPFIKSLGVEAGYRYSDYSTAGETDTYKLGLNYTLNNDLRFRYSYNRAVRAPNIVELYTPITLGLFTGSDPCASPNAANGTLKAQCLAQGVPLAVLSRGAASGTDPCPASQCTSTTGGNPKLAPESADTYTYGFVLTPSMLPRFSLSVDYYNIRVNNLISAGLGGAGAQLAGCFAGQTSLCSTIHRDPVTGDIFGAGYVSGGDVNAGFLQTKGVDIASNYSYVLPAALGRLDINAVGTYVQSFVTEPYAGSGTYDCAGLYGVKCGTPTPRFRAKVRLTWKPDAPYTLSLQWRYTSQVKFDGNSSNLFLSDGSPYTIIDAKIPDYNYFDLTGTWKVKQGYTLRFGVNNLFDKQPPAQDSNNYGATGGGNGNTFPGTYDTLGRNIFLGLTADF